MRSPQTMGEADPRPGISTFQRTFFVSLQSSGGLADFEMPLASGPRHWGQNRSAGGAWANGRPIVKRAAAAAITTTRYRGLTNGSSGRCSTRGASSRVAMNARLDDTLAKDT